MPDIAAKMLGIVLCSPTAALGIGSAFAGQPVERQLLTQETTPAMPAPHTCLAHDSANQKLRQEFGEKLLGQGVSKDGTLLEIFMAPAGTFTVIKTTPDGLSCVVDFGDGWKTLNQIDSVGFTPDDLKSPTAPF